MISPRRPATAGLLALFAAVAAFVVAVSWPAADPSAGDVPEPGAPLVEGARPLLGGESDSAQRRDATPSAGEVGTLVLDLRDEPGASELVRGRGLAVVEQLDTDGWTPVPACTAQSSTGIAVPVDARGRRVGRPLRTKPGPHELEVPADKFLRTVWEFRGSVHVERLGPLAAGERRSVRIDHRDDRTAYFGRVLGADGPLAGATIEAFGVQHDRSDHDGVFELEFLRGDPPELRISAAGHVEIEVVPGAQHGRREIAEEWMLDAYASLATTVFDHAGEPFEGATVSVVRTDGKLEPVERSIPGSLVTYRDRPAPKTWERTTDEDGLARFDDLPPRVPLRVSVVRPRGSDGLAHLRAPLSLDLEPGEERETTWRAPSRYALRGRVIDQDDRPVYPLQVGLFAPDPDEPAPRYLERGDEPVATAWTTRDGSFAFDTVPEGTWLVGPPWNVANSHHGRRLSPLAVPIEVSATSSKWTHRLRIGRGLEIRGRVTDADGLPLEGIAIAADRPRTEGAMTTRTDADGRFLLHRLAPGVHHVRAPSSDGPPATRRCDAGDTDVRLRVGR